jgi:hypothetical protein
MKADSLNYDLDPAAVFACAKSLHHACMDRMQVDADLDLAKAYHGMDGFMREVMRVADLFENWACKHVAFHEFSEAWPYWLEERFGDACLEVMHAGALVGYDAEDCLRVAFKLRLPIRVDPSLPLPVCMEAANPLAGAQFQRLRIQTVRMELRDDRHVTPFTEDDDPFDENFGAPFFGIYGVDAFGLLVHFADRDNYQSARSLLTDLLPGIDFPEQINVFSFGLTR